MNEEISSITQVLNDWTDLRNDEKNNIIKILYPELKRIASLQLNNNNITQSTTEVVNEAYIKLMEQNSKLKNRGHFFAIAATVMRRIVVDLSRKKMAIKRGANVNHVDIDDVSIPVPFSFSNWIVLDNAIDELNKINPILTKVIELKAIMGMNIQESSEILNISMSTFNRHWKFSKVWLADYLSSQ